jgi:hypothetical protein
MEVPNVIDASYTLLSKIIGHFKRLASALSLDALLVDTDMPLLQNINGLLSFDPVSLITLFLDLAEKDLVARTGDLNLLSWFGLFVNPSTVWREYGTLYPDQGLRYYVPDAMLTSTIEVAQVHEFLRRLACGRRNCGIIIRLQPSSQLSSWKSSPWVWMARPLLPCVLLIVAGLNLDVWAFGAIGCLLLAQTIGIAQTRLDSLRQKRNSVVVDENQPEQVTTLFLANNVTILVKSSGDLFKQGVSSIFCEKLEKPVFVEMLTILIFMAGVLMVGFSHINFKATYLLGHAVQAMVIALANGSKLNICSVNGVTWQVENHEEALEHRRNAYVWVTRNTIRREVAWLVQLMNNPKSLVEFVREDMIVL